MEKQNKQLVLGKKDQNLDNNGQKMKALSIGNGLWNHIDENLEGIREYLLGECQRENANIFLYYALKLVAIELMLNKKNYDAFPALKYSKEDFVDIIIECIAEVPTTGNIEDYKKKHNDCRKIAWGYIKSKYEDVLTVIENMHSSLSTSEKLNEKAVNLMYECLTVIYTEALIRRNELIILELSIL